MRMINKKRSLLQINTIYIRFRPEAAMEVSATKNMHCHCWHFFDFGIALKPINKSFLNELIKAILSAIIILLLNTHETRKIVIFSMQSKFLFGCVSQIGQFGSFTKHVESLKSCLLNSSVIILLKILLCLVTQGCI